MARIRKSRSRKDLFAGKIMSCGWHKGADHDKVYVIHFSDANSGLYAALELTEAEARQINCSLGKYLNEEKTTLV